MLLAAIESPEGEIIAVYGHGDEAKAEYDGLKKTPPRRRWRSGKVVAVQA